MEPKDKIIKVLFFDEVLEMTEKDFEILNKVQQVLDAQRLEWYKENVEDKPLIINYDGQSALGSLKLNEEIDTEFKVDSEGRLLRTEEQEARNVRRAQDCKDFILKLLGGQLK